jgi:hypothetical protein
MLSKRRTRGSLVVLQWRIKLADNAVHIELVLDDPGNSGMGVPGRGFTDIDSGTRKVVAEALIMLEEPAKFELAHRLLAGTLHGGYEARTTMEL